jgi:hypothetical protein
MICLTTGVLAQECQVVEDYQDGTYLVKINNVTLLAITDEMQREMLKVKQDLFDARREIPKKDQLLADYENFRAQYEVTLKHQQEYIQELEALLEGYKAMHKKYKNLKEPWLTVEGGVGATGDSDPAVLFGLGIRSIRVWGFLQESNAGGLIGMTFPIF